ncbi:MAG TPA: hypothetical protein VJM74_06460 [Nitrososphaeraceae archaeon]|nr:hypothetical protein [Nitrososphaeraceae archaeon]
MPGLNGLELLKKVKTSNPKVRTILMSAYDFEEEDLYQIYERSCDRLNYLKTCYDE